MLASPNLQEMPIGLFLVCTSVLRPKVHELRSSGHRYRVRDYYNPMFRLFRIDTTSISVSQKIWQEKVMGTKGSLQRLLGRQIDTQFRIISLLFVRRKLAGMVSTATVFVMQQL